MKIIEAMRLVKISQEKVSDLKEKVSKHCADLDFETPVYPDQAKQVREWVQSVQDINKEILRLRIAIQRTNLETKATVELGGKTVTKTVAEWIHRRRDLATSDFEVWSKLGDRGLREGALPSSAGGEQKPVKIRRYYDPSIRDQMVSLYKEEPHLIDSTLEITNAVTDIIE